MTHSVVWLPDITIDWYFRRKIMYSITQRSLCKHSHIKFYINGCSQIPKLLCHKSLWKHNVVYRKLIKTPLSVPSIALKWRGRYLTRSGTQFTQSSVLLAAESRRKKGVSKPRESKRQRKKSSLYTIRQVPYLSPDQHVFFPVYRTQKGQQKPKGRTTPSLPPTKKKREKKRRTSRTTTLEKKKKKADEEKTGEKRRAGACPYFSRRGSALFCKNNVIRLPISSE